MRNPHRNPGAAPHGAPPAGARIAGLDVARALAIVGMLAVNVGPRDADGLGGLFTRVPYGRASLLFVLLAGVGVSLLTRRARRPGGSVPLGDLSWRAGLLLLGGLALQRLDHEVNVILPTYAVLFLVALPLLRAPDRLVLGSGVAMLVLGPLVWVGVQLWTGTTFTMEPAAWGEGAGGILYRIVLAGPYPVVTWVAPFLLGMWLGRQRLDDPRIQRLLLVVGATAAVGGLAASRLLTAVLGQPGEEPGLDRLLSAVAHSQMPLWLVSGAGSALATLGAVLLVAPRLGRWLRPLASVGRLSLTTYVAHLFVLVAVRPGPGSVAEGAAVTAAIAVGATVFATWWSARHRHGPLELILRGPRVVQPAPPAPVLARADRATRAGARG